MELLTDELAEAAGLRRYEVANLARPGQESRHNLLYWRRRPYLALGPGAHASDGGSRRTWNAARLDGYIGALEPGPAAAGWRRRRSTRPRRWPSGHPGAAPDARASTPELAAQPGAARRPSSGPAQQGLAEDVAGRTRLDAAGSTAGQRGLRPAAAGLRRCSHAARGQGA